LRASAAARGSSGKSDTRPELKLRSALHRAGRRFRKNVQSLPGCPDIVFPRQKVVIFCDGDFWHGREWSERKEKLRRGSNCEYWIAKIERNIERDAQNQEQLEMQGWFVLRFWESEIEKDGVAVLFEIIEALEGAQSRDELAADQNFHVLS
jgi:DNA mismatch endonuclease (patch repair protein)